MMRDTKCPYGGPEYPTSLLAGGEETIEVLTTRALPRPSLSPREKSYLGNQPT
jgi:hypothetical protein